MNGGYAVRLACKRDRVLVALAAIAAQEQLELVDLVGRHERAGDELALWFGVATKGRETIIVPAEHGAEDADGLNGLGEALAAQLGCKTSVVLDFDDGCEIVRSWHGGETMSRKTGWPSWDDAGYLRFALGPPRFAPVPATEARAVIPALQRALPFTVTEIGANIVGLARPEVRGPVSGARPAWQITLDVPGHGLVSAVASVSPGGEDQLAERAPWDVACRFDRIPALATRRVTAGDALFRAVAAALDVPVEALEREGFAQATWFARVRLDGGLVTVECRTRHAGDPVERELADVVRALRGAVASERAARTETVHESYDAIIQRQLKGGDFDAAAATYRELHASFYKTLDEARAISASLAKVRELAKLYVR